MKDSTRTALPHHELGLTDDQVIEMYKIMLTARRYDERALLLQRAGKINFHISGIGMEPAQVGAAFAMDRETDYFLPYYRDYAFVLALGMTLDELMLSLFAKAGDPNSGGRQMPGHFSCRRLHIVTGSSPVTTQVPHAVGFALAARIKQQRFATIVSFGDGSSNQGDFHEGVNFAAVHKLPVIFLCQNNQYAISVPYRKQVATETIAERAAAYGIPGFRVDAGDPLEMYRVTKEARERALNGEGPTLIEAWGYRLTPHSTSDNDLAYRTREEVEEHWKKDGLPRFRDYLKACGLWDDSRDRALDEQIAGQLKASIQYAEQSPSPEPEDLFRHVYAEEE